MDFQSILFDHGITRDTYDIDSAIIAWSHELHAYLLDETSCFDLERSRVDRQDDADAYLNCTLVTNGESAMCAVQCLLTRWVSDLRFKCSTREIIDTNIVDDQAVVRVLNISQHCAITIRLTITQGGEAV